MSCVEFHPWNSRRADTEKPDEWRIDLDPMPDATFDTVRKVAGVVQEVLEELGAVGFPKTSGSKGLHIYVRIEPNWGFADVRRAAHAFAREVERRADDLVDLTWWRKDRDPSTVFVDYNQNARDHTIRSAYSVIGVPEARVSTPIRWDEVADVDPREFTIATVPARYAELGDLHADIDDHPYSTWSRCSNGPTGTRPRDRRSPTSTRTISLHACQKPTACSARSSPGTSRPRGARDRDHLAFRDINPQAAVHVLVVPRTHYEDAEELAKADPQVLADVHHHRRGGRQAARGSTETGLPGRVQHRRARRADRLPRASARARRRAARAVRASHRLSTGNVDANCR